MKKYIEHMNERCELCNHTQDEAHAKASKDKLFNVLISTTEITEYSSVEEECSCFCHLT